MYRIELESGRALDALQDLLARGSDLAPAMREISEAMLGTVEDAFANEEDPATGEPWAELAASTVQDRGGDAHPILQRTGRLAASWSTDSGPDYAQAGTNVIYAGVMQQGADAGEFGTDSAGRPLPWGDIPARPMAGWAPTLEDDVLDIAQRHLLGR